MSKQTNKSLNFIKNQLSEHFDNFVVIAIDQQGNLVWDYNNWMIAVMMMERAKDEIEEDDVVDFILSDDDDTDDDGFHTVGG